MKHQENVTTGSRSHTTHFCFINNRVDFYVFMFLFVLVKVEGRRSKVVVTGLVSGEEYLGEPVAGHLYRPLRGSNLRPQTHCCVWFLCPHVCIILV